MQQWMPRHPYRVPSLLEFLTFQRDRIRRNPAAAEPVTWDMAQATSSKATRIQYLVLLGIKILEERLRDGRPWVWIKDERDQLNKINLVTLPDHAIQGMQRFLSLQRDPRAKEGRDLLANPRYYEHLTDGAHPSLGPRKPPIAEVLEMNAARAYDTGVRWEDFGLQTLRKMSTTTTTTWSMNQSRNERQAYGAAWSQSYGGRTTARGPYYHRSPHWSQTPDWRRTTGPQTWSHEASTTSQGRWPPSVTYGGSSSSTDVQPRRGRFADGSWQGWTSPYQ